MARLTPPTLAQFLAKYVDGYLIEDIERLKAVVPEEGKEMGACGYPLVMTVCSGIELLGAVSSPRKIDFRRRDLPSLNFLRYWRTYLYPKDRNFKRAGRGVYGLARHGVAHAFLMKGPLVVTKREAGPPLSRTPEREVVINSTTLADDFINSYRTTFTKATASRHDAMQKRVHQIWTKYFETAKGKPGIAGGKRSPGLLRFFGRLPPHASFGPGPLPRSAVSPSGASVPRPGQQPPPQAPAGPTLPVRGPSGPGPLPGPAVSPSGPSVPGPVYVTHQAPGAPNVSITQSFTTK